jgi:uncharacterized protein YqfA (UPF0365 family)
MLLYLANVPPLSQPAPLLLADAMWVWVALAMLLFLFIAVLVVMTSLFSPWFQAFMSGTPISVLNIVGMRMRKVDAKQVIRCGIMANQAGCPVPWPQLETAQLQGVDLEKVTLAHIEAHRQDRGYTFDQLVDAERRSRLSEMLE